jgi:hypothetical protein
MRLPLISLALVALAGLTPAPASAEIGYMTNYHYEACTCSFGYLENACMVRNSCVTEGGRCLAPCHVETPQSLEAEAPKGTETPQSPALRVRD